jgi:hypothetical protein
MITLCPDASKCSESLLEPNSLGGSAETTIEGATKACQWLATRSGPNSLWDVHIVTGDASKEMEEEIFAELSDNLPGFIDKLRAERQA